MAPVIHPPVKGPRIIPFGEERRAEDVLSNGRPAFRVTQTYDSIDWFWSKPENGGLQIKHRALDLGNQHCDDEVIAPADGIAFPLVDEFGALCAEVRMDNGLVARMWHLAKVNIDAGQRVTRGQFLGRNGGTGLAAGVCHVHFEILRNGEKIDPWPLLAQNKARYARVNGTAQVNIRRGPGKGSDLAPVFAQAKGDRILRSRDGADLGSRRAKRRFGGFVQGARHGIGAHPETWARLWIGGAHRYVARPLVTIDRD